MSLFQIRDSWSYKPTSEEECGIGCLAVANVNNSEDGKNKIICGGYSGLLHIYQPSDNKDDDATVADDVLLEINLEIPILQVACGNFVSSTSGIHLAVLHPRLLVIYRVSLSDGKQCKLDIMYQHKLERTSASMTWGPFGSKEINDFICVQSMDGALSLYRHETYMFTRFLPSFVLPSPFVYSSFNDSFITVSSSNFLECYSYQALAVASELSSESSQLQQNTTGGKRLTVDWSFNIGESALDICVVQQESNKPAIMVLGDRCMYCVEMTGKLRFMKKFDYSVACFKVVEKNQQIGIKTIVATHSKQLLIFNNAKLQWAAQLFAVPICIEISQIKNVEGTLVLLQDDFQLSCSYLGTSPTLFTIPRSQQRCQDVDEMEKEIVRLRNNIKDLQRTDQYDIGGAVNNNKCPVTITSQVVMATDSDHKLSKRMTEENSSEHQQPSIVCEIKVESTRKLEDTQVSLQCPLGLCSSFKQQVIPSFGAPSNGIWKTSTRISLEGNCLPSCLEVEVVVCYHLQQESTQVVSHKIHLPLSLISHPCVATSNNKMEHRVTLETNLPCVDLTSLLNDLCDDSSTPTLLGIQYIHGPKATILTSKSNNRYRIQCEEYAGLWLIVSTFVRRLHHYNNQIVITCNEKPSLEPLYQLIDRHLEVRRATKEVCELLEQRSRQYRSIQRRLLSKFQDKTPQNLNCLDSLLEGTHEQLMTLIEAHEDYTQLLTRITSNLQSACHLISLLCHLYCDGFHNKEIVDCVLVTSGCLQQASSHSTGWEESVVSSIQHLIRTKSQNNTNTMELKQPADAVKLKKQLTSFLDRLCKKEQLWSRSDNALKKAENRNE